MADQIVSMLQAGTSPDRNIRNQATAALKQAEQQPEFPQLLMQIIQQPDAAIALLAAVQLKNLIRRHWVVSEDSDFAIVDSSKASLKSHILQLVLASTGNVQAQLAECLTIVSSHEFPSKWPELVPELVQRLQAQNTHVFGGILHVAHSIFKGFRHKFKSDELFTQIKYVVDQFGPTFLNTFKAVAAEVARATGEGAAQQNQDSITQLYRAAHLAAKIFIDLNFQELPEFFEDNLQAFMEGFHVMLVAEHPLLAPTTPDVPTLQIELRATICEALNLFLEKYDEEFAPYLQTLLTDVWNLLLKCGPEPLFDVLIINASHFLTTVLTGPSHSLLKDPAILKQICESVVVPNIQLREVDEENFEGDPEDFIRQDIEGSDHETRRRSAHDLVRGLLKYFEEQVTAIFMQYVTATLAAPPAEETALCRAKDACMCLITAVGAKGTTAAAGAVDVNSLVNVVDFFTNHVVPELQSPMDHRPILKASALKFTATFRTQLSASMANEILGAAMGLLRSENEVVQSYAANLIGKMLAMKNPQTRQLMFTPDHITPVATQLLTELFGVIGRELPSSVCENIYAIHAIMRVARIQQEKMLVNAEMCIMQIKAILDKVIQNPNNPKFNHYLFECIASLVKYIVSAQPSLADSFETVLFPYFQNILSMDVAEFIPYVLQLLALLLEVRTKPVPAVYFNLLPGFLNVTMYERDSNVAPLAMLLGAFVRHAPNEIVEGNHLQGILGVFQFLVSKRAHDHDGYRLLNTILIHLPPEKYQPFLPNIFQILLLRLQNSSTAKYERNLCLTMCKLCAKHGPSSLINSLEQIQAGLSGQILNLIMPKCLLQAANVGGHRVVAVGCTRLLCESSGLFSSPPASWAAPTLTQLLALLEQGPKRAEDDPDAEFEAVEKAAAGGQLGTAHSKLVFAAVTPADDFPNLPESKQYLTNSLVAGCKAHNAAVPAVMTGLEPQAGQVLAGYLRAVGVQI